MKKYLGSLALFLALSGSVPAQNPTAVTGTIIDPSSVAYYPAQVTACLSPVTIRPTVGGQLVNPNIGTNYCIGPVSTAINGSFSMGLHANANITPGATTWIFTVTTLGSAPPAGTGSQTFQSSGITISGASQDVGATLSALAPKLLSGGSSVSPNSPLPLATSGPGPVFNVANYAGAFHDTRSNSTCDSSISATQVTCSAVAGVTPFTSADVGKRINCSDANGSKYYPAGTTITSIVSGTVAQLSGTRLVASPGAKCVYGHPDDVALVASMTAALAQTTAIAGQAVGNAGIPTATPTIYLPAGGWMLCQPSSGIPMYGFFTGRKGFKIKGDGFDVTWLYNCDNVTTSIADGFWINNSNITTLYLEDFTIDGGFMPVSMGGFHGALSTTQETIIKNVHLQAIRAAGGAVLNGAVYADKFVIDTSDGTQFNCVGCGGEFHNWSVSNAPASGSNIAIQNVFGLNTGPGLRMWGGLVDEGGSTPVTKIINSQDVWFIGTGGFGTGAAYAMSVDGTSFVHLIDGIWGVFGNDGNAGGISIAAGGVVQASDTRFVSSGTRACIANLGTFNDNGGNSCENMFQIASGTSTGTTAVLTLTNAGAAVNTNCSVGDALVVEGASPLGYNGYFPAGATSGVTATGATTLTYTTAGSNLGAALAVGVAFCRNLQGYTGNLPKALLNNPIPNTCYYTITPIANATTVTLCNFSTGTATNVTRIRASSQATTTCATAPIITISDGTATQTLTLTSAKSSWDSSVDASTGVGTTIFKPNGTITVKYDVAAASACATPPTNLAVSYNISPILSN